jgi:BNR repeat protein
LSEARLLVFKRRRGRRCGSKGHEESHQEKCLCHQARTASIKCLWYHETILSVKALFGEVAGTALYLRSTRSRGDSNLYCRPGRHSGVRFVGPLFLVIIIAIFAGCISTPDNLDPSRNNPLGAVGLFRAVVVPRDSPGFEPGIAVASTGAFFLCAPNGAGFGTDLWRSLDEGTTFEYLGTPLAPGGPVVRSTTGDLGGGDCDMATDEGDRVYLVDLWGGSSSIVSSNDQGMTWSGAPLSQLRSPMDRPWAVGGLGDEVFVSGAQLQPSGFNNHGLSAPPVGGIWVARSVDGGRTFPQQVLAVENAGRLDLNGNLVVGGGTLALLYTREVSASRLALMVATSTDRGASWHSTTVAEQDFIPRACFPVMIFPVIAPGGDGALFLAWTLQNPATNRTDLFFASSPDGQHWNAPRLLADREGTRLYPWISASPTGRVGVVWYESNVTTRYDWVDPLGPDGVQCEFKDAGDAEWHLHYAWSDDAAAPSANFTESLVQPEILHRGPLGRPYAERIDLDFLPDGRAVVAYVGDVPQGTARLLVAVEAGGAEAPALVRSGASARALQLPVDIGSPRLSQGS